MKIQEISMWNTFWLADKNGDRKIKNEELIGERIPQVEGANEDIGIVEDEDTSDEDSMGIFSQINDDTSTEEQEDVAVGPPKFTKKNISSIDKDESGSVSILEWDNYIRGQIDLRDPESEEIIELNKATEKLTKKRELPKYFTKNSEELSPSKFASYFTITRSCLEAKIDKGDIEQFMEKIIELEAKDPFALEKVASIFKGIGDTEISSEKIKEIFPKIVFIYRNMITNVADRSDLRILEKEMFCFLKIYFKMQAGQKKTEEATAAFGDTNSAAPSKKVSFAHVRNKFSTKISEVSKEHSSADEMTFVGLYSFFKDGNYALDDISVMDIYLKHMEESEKEATGNGLDIAE